MREELLPSPSFNSLQCQGQVPKEVSSHTSCASSFSSTAAPCPRITHSLSIKWPAQLLVNSGPCDDFNQECLWALPLTWEDKSAKIVPRNNSKGWEITRSLGCWLHPQPAVVGRALVSPACLHLSAVSGTAVASGKLVLAQVLLRGQSSGIL